MYINKNIKIVLFIACVLSAIAMLFSQYDMYNYIDDIIYEYKEQFESYQQQIDLYEDGINTCKSELADAKIELENLKQELEDVKNELSNVKKDISSLQKSIKNISPSSSGYPSTNNNGEYVGRLYIPEAGISVALYNGWAQSITDRYDSANYFSLLPITDNIIIADHNNQAFSKLHKVKVNTTGYIEFKNGAVENIVCVEVFSGYNKKSDITDKNGNSVSKKEDYLTYTCQNGWQNILICLWTIV